MYRVIIGLEHPLVQKTVLNLPSCEKQWFGLKKNCSEINFENHYFYSDAFFADNYQLLVDVQLPDELKKTFHQKLPVYLNQFSRSRFGRDRLASDNEIYLLLVLKWVYRQFGDKELRWFFTDAPPHFGFDEIISDYMRWRSVPVFYGCETLLPNRFVVIDEKMDFIKPAAGEEDRDIALPPIQGEQIFYMENIKYFRLSKRKMVGWGLKHLLGLSKDTFLWTNYRISLGRRYIENINKTFEKVTGFENLKKQVNSNFIYFALHMQPEMTTSALGGKFVDQILAIEHLANRLPKEWKILVKENPIQNFRHRSDAFFERLQKIPNVVLIDRRASSRYLIEQSKIVATISGTVGWESVRMKKPVIIFGWAWYKGLDGVYSYSELNEGLEEIANKEITDQSLQASYQDILGHFWPGCIEMGYTEIMSEQQVSECESNIGKLVARLDELTAS